VHFAAHLVSAPHLSHAWTGCLHSMISATPPAFFNYAYGARYPATPLLVPSTLVTWSAYYPTYHNTGSGALFWTRAEGRYSCYMPAYTYTTASHLPASILLPRSRAMGSLGHCLWGSSGFALGFCHANHSRYGTEEEHSSRHDPGLPRMVRCGGWLVCNAHARLPT